VAQATELVVCGVKIGT